MAVGINNGLTGTIADGLTFDNTFPVSGSDNNSQKFRDNYKVLQANIENIQTKTISLSGDGTGTSAIIDSGVSTVTVPFTLSNTGVTAGSYSLASLTIDAKGRITSATSALSLLDTKLNLSGGTMTGALVLSGAPTANLQAATKKYVDDSIAAGGIAASKVDKAGDTMTGFLTLSANPVNALHAATKQYVDLSISGATGSFVNTTGDTMTGALILNTSSPTTSLQAASKGYVDTRDALQLNLTGGTLSGFLTLHAIPSSTFHAATKGYVDTQITTSASTIATNLKTNELTADNGTTSGAETILSGISAGSNAVNYGVVYNSISGNPIIFGTTGPDTDIDLEFRTTGNGYIVAHVAYDMSSAGANAFTTKSYTDASFLIKSGGTLTGFLTLHTDPVNDLHAVTKQYVDNLFFVQNSENLIGQTSGAGLLIVDGISIDNATNWIRITNAITGESPSIKVTGGDTNNDLVLTGNGTGYVRGETGYDMSSGPDSAFATKEYVDIQIGFNPADLNTQSLTVDDGTASGGSLILEGITVGTPANWLTVTNAIAGASPSLGVGGFNTNNNLLLIPAGTGYVQIEGSGLTIGDGAQPTTLLPTEIQTQTLQAGTIESFNAGDINITSDSGTKVIITGTGGVEINASGSNRVLIEGQGFPTSAGLDGQILIANGGNLEYADQNSDFAGTITYRNGNFSVSNDALSKQYILHTSTTDATETELFIGGAIATGANGELSAKSLEVVSAIVVDPSINVTPGDILDIIGGEQPISSASVIDGGTGYTIGDILTVVGGTYTTPATFTVTGESIGGVTTVSLLYGGEYSVYPTNPVLVTGGTGGGAQLNITAASKARLQVDTTKAVGTVVVLDGGSNYTTGDILTVNEGTGSAIIDATLEVDSITTDSINSIYEAGQGYFPNDVLEVDGGVYTSQTEILVTEVALVSATVVDRGTDQTPGSTFTVLDGSPTTPAQITIDTVTAQEAFVNTPGSGHLPNDRLIVNGGARAISTIIGLVDGGTGYTVDDVLTVVGGIGTAATFTVTSVSGGMIDGIVLTSGGSYTTFPGNSTDPVSVTGGTGGGAMFEVRYGEKSEIIVENVEISSIASIGSPGTGYETGDVLTVLGGTGIDIGTLTVSSVSAVSAQPFYHGQGYVVGDTVTLVGGTSSQAAIFDVDAIKPTQVSVVSGGTDYEPGDIMVALGGTFNQQAQLTIDTVSANSISSVAAPGTGYLPGDVLTVVGGSPNLAATINVGNVTAISATVAAAGSGYAIGDILTVSNGTIVTAPRFTITAVRAVSITIANAGTGYSTGQTLTVVGGTGTAATIQISLAVAGQVVAASVLTGGSYTAIPSNPVAVTGGTGSNAQFNITSYGASTLSLHTAGLMSAVTNPATVTGGSGASATLTVSYGLSAVTINEDGDYGDIPSNPVSLINGSGTGGQINILYKALTAYVSLAGSYTVAPSNPISVAGLGSNDATFNLTFGIDTLSVNTAGNYTVSPTNPVSVTGGTGTSATVNASFGILTASVTERGDYSDVPNNPVSVIGGNDDATVNLVWRPSSVLVFKGGSYSTVPTNPASTTAITGSGIDLTVDLGSYGADTAKVTVAGSYELDVPNNPALVIGNEATFNLSFGVESASIISSGEYSVFPSNPVPTTGVSGTGAKINISSTILSASIVNGGSYTSNPSGAISVTGPGDDNASFLIQGFGARELSIVQTGTYTTIPSSPTATTGSGVITVTLDGGIKEVNIDAGGNDYTTSATVSTTPGTANLTLVVSSEGVITGVTVNDSGSGFSSINSTSITLPVGTSGSRLILTNDSTWFFEIHVAARDIDTNNVSAGWVLKGVAENNNGTISLITTESKETFNNISSSAWDIDLDVNSVTDAIVLNATGSASTNIRWLAVVRTVEIIG